jgi:hypothetical protein
MRRIGIALEWPHANDASAFDLGEKRTPVRVMTDEMHGVDSLRSGQLYHTRRCHRRA